MRSADLRSASREGPLRTERQPGLPPVVGAAAPPPVGPGTLRVPAPLASNKQNTR